MSTNTTVLNAIKATNEAKQKQVEAEAAQLVRYILNEQASAAKYEAEIKLHREELAKTAHDVIDYKVVTGGAAPNSPNLNEVTIGKVISKLNEDKQKSVEVVATRLSAAITDKQASIKAINDRINELRGKLAKVSAELVTTETVLG